MRKGFSFSIFTGLIFWGLALTVCAAPFRRMPPAMPLYSRDGLIVIQSPGDRSLYRSPILIFTDRVRQDVERVIGKRVSADNGLLEVAIGSATNRVTMLHAYHFRDRGSGALKERIEVPDPEGVDLQKLRAAVCDALVRLMIAEKGRPGVTLAPPPPWVGMGLARYTIRENRPLDIDRAMRLWSNACLPAAYELFDMESAAATSEPAVAAALVGMLLEKWPKGRAFDRLLRDSAMGKRWTPDLLAETMGVEKDPHLLDAKVDEAFLAYGRTVVLPGVTTDGVVRRFRSALLLFAPLFDKLTLSYRRSFSFHEAISYAENPLFRAEALAQARHLRVMATGRDGTLLEVAQAYERFLYAFAMGNKPGELLQLLRQAETARAKMERRTSHGEILQKRSE